MVSAHTASNEPSMRTVILLGAIITLGNLGTILHKSSRVYLFQQAQCLEYYRIYDPTKISSNYHIEESLCKLPTIQSRLSIIDGVDSFLQCLPPLLVLGMYRQLVEYVGLRSVLCFNLCCAALAVLYSIASFWLHQHWSTEAALLFFIFDLIGGGDSIRITMACACIANITPAGNLTNVYNCISGFYFLASVSGSAIGSLLLSGHVYILNGLSVLCYLLTVPVVTMIPPACGQSEEKEESVETSIHANENDPLISATANRDLEVPCHCSKRILSQLLMRSWQASSSSLLTLFASSNPTFTVILVLLINGIAARIGAILPQYTSLALGWPLATVNRLLALKALVSAASLFALPLMRKQFLEPRFPGGSQGAIAIDLLITQVSLIANTVGVIGLGFSTSRVAIFTVSLCLYTSGSGLADSLISFGTHTLDKGEMVADFYVRTGLVNAVAALIGGPMWSVAMGCVIRSEWIPLGTPFWVCAGVFGVGYAGVVTLKRV